MDTLLKILFYAVFPLCILLIVAYWIAKGTVVFYLAINFLIELFK